MANKNQDAKRANSKRARSEKQTTKKKTEKTAYQKERDAMKAQKHRKHNRDPYNSTRGC